MYTFMFCCIIKDEIMNYRKVPNFRTPENIAVIYLKLKQKGPNLRVFHQKDLNGIANGEDPDQSDLGLHCLPRPICEKT